MSDRDHDKFDLVFPVLLVVEMVWIIAIGITLLVAGVYAMIIAAICGFFVIMFCLVGAAVYGILTGRM